MVDKKRIEWISTSLYVEVEKNFVDNCVSTYRASAYGGEMYKNCILGITVKIHVESPTTIIQEIYLVPLLPYFAVTLHSIYFYL